MSAVWRVVGVVWRVVCVVVVGGRVCVCVEEEHVCAYVRTEARSGTC